MTLQSRSRTSSTVFFLLVALIAVSLFAGLGMREPSPPDEPRFVLAAKDMVATGQWMLPHRGSEFYAEKPAVFMWMQAAAYKIVGNWRIAFLLPSLLAALTTLWLTWDLTRRLWNRRVAGYAVLALFVCLQFGLQAKRGQIDMVLVAMTTLSLWGFLQHLLLGPNRKLLWLGLFAAGLGTVTKGVGFLPLLIVLPWAAWRWRYGPRVERGSAVATARTWLLGVLCFIVGAGVWLFPMLLAVHAQHDPAAQAYAEEILLRQTGTRYANAWHHVQPAWYYLQVMVTLWLPGALLLPWLLPAWWRRIRRGDPRFWLLLGWAVLVLAFFTASPGKREVYIFPALPALCIAAAPLLQGLLRRRGVRWTLFSYLAALALLASAASLSAWSGVSHWAEHQAARRGIDEQTVQVVLAWMLAFGVAVFGLLFWLRVRRIGVALVLATACLWLVYGIGLAPALDADSSASRLMQAVGRHIGPDAQLGMVAWREQNLLQSDRPAVDFGFKKSWEQQWAAAGSWLEQDPVRRWIFVLQQAVSPCADATQVVDIGQSNRNRWSLVPGTAWKAGCVTPPFSQDDGDEPSQALTVDGNGS